MAADPTPSASLRARPLAMLPDRPARAVSPTATTRLAAAERLLVRRGEAMTVVGLVALTTLAEWPLLHGRIVAGLDSLSQFYPWYALVGASLREGGLPGWNPYTMAGGPLAGNPLSGWTYLPAMLLFTALPFGAAVVAYQVVHVLLASVASYGLARALGIGIAGASLAALAYGQSGLIAAQAACCFAFASVGAWLPVLLLGSELALRAGGLASRVRGWALAALALSQILASWPGQGSYYALIVFGSFVLFRVPLQWACVAVAHAGRPWPALVTIGQLGLHGAMPVLLGMGLAAAGLLPRIELNALSSLAGGYAAEDLHVGGWTISEWSGLVEPGYWYVGLGVVGLALLAAWLARRRPLAWYLLAVGATLLALAMPGPSPVHDLFGLLPGFSSLHPHLPDRIMTVFVLVPALLAGLSVDVLARVSRHGSVVAVLLVGLAFADLRVAREQTFTGYAEADGIHRLMTVDLEEYYTPAPAARFLRSRLWVEGPFRYLGYDPGPTGLAYTQRFADPRTVQLGVNNRAVSGRLLDVQGYDAVHLARFDAWLRAANGRAQNYHNADLFGPGLRSPLLDLLSVRYLVTPSGPDAFSDGCPLIEPRFRVVFDDGRTRVLRNEAAPPWAWIVHDARAASASEALDLLSSGLVDPRQTVLLEPPLRSPLDPAVVMRLLTGELPPDQATLPDPSRLRAAGAASEGRGDEVSVLQFEADRLLLRARTEGDGVLVLAEVAYPGWQATVDGTPTPIYVANGLLRALSLPAGEHLVELRFDSPTLRVGVAVSLLTATVLAGCCVAPLVVSSRRWRQP
jgi:hypothetical protein